MAGMTVELQWGQEKVVTSETFGVREHFLGQKGMTPDGRTFRWCYSAGAIAAGTVVSTGPGVSTAEDDLVVVTGAAGSLELAIAFRLLAEPGVVK